MPRPKHFRIPRHTHKNSLDTTSDGRQEDLADLQADDEGKRHDHSGEITIGVVVRFGELEVQVRQEGGDVSHAHRAHGKYGAHEAVVDEHIDAAIFHHRPGVLGCRNIRLAVQRDVAKRVAVEQRHKPVEQRDQTAQDTREDGPNNTAFCGFVALQHRACLSEGVNECDDQTAQTDAAKGVGRRAGEGTARGAFGKGLRALAHVRRRRVRVYGVEVP